MNQKFKIDSIVRETGHDVLRLPPDHPDLNPIENIWGILKGNVASQNVKFDLSEVIKLTNMEFERVDYRNHWRKSCAKAWHTLVKQNKVNPNDCSR